MHPDLDLLHCELSFLKQTNDPCDFVGLESPTLRVSHKFTRNYKESGSGAKNTSFEGWRSIWLAARIHDVTSEFEALPRSQVNRRCQRHRICQGEASAPAVAPRQ